MKSIHKYLKTKCLPGQRYIIWMGVCVGSTEGKVASFTYARSSTLNITRLVNRWYKYNESNGEGDVLI